MGRADRRCGIRHRLRSPAPSPPAGRELPAHLRGGHRVRHHHLHGYQCHRTGRAVRLPGQGAPGRGEKRAVQLRQGGPPGVRAGTRLDAGADARTHTGTYPRTYAPTGGSRAAARAAEPAGSGQQRRFGHPVLGRPGRRQHNRLPGAPAVP